MSKNKHWSLGNYVEITLESNRVCYGVVTSEEHMAIMDYCSENELDESEISSLTILFIVPMMKYSIGKKGWELSGAIKDHKKFIQSPSFFKKDSINGKLSIVDSSFINEVSATEKECNGLECAAVWDPCHVIERLNEHYPIH
jgi:hypothetical protein